MPAVPDDVVQAAMAAVFARDDPDALSAEELARVILEAAAPLLAGHAARAVLAHMEAHGPPDGARRARWRLHLGTAAQVAAGAFSTREDRLREAAQALAKGNYMGCDLREEDHG